ncbi:MAG: hypothetical protein ABIA37_05495, partial [Candidatus Woesearchaeota archaeon]
MNKKLITTLYLLLFLIMAVSVLAATKPISGYVVLANGSAAENATVIVYVNTSFSFVNPCYTLPSVLSGSDGSYATNLGNLKRADNNLDCSGLWATGDVIWAFANGSTVFPTARGNNNSVPTTISSGTGLQTLSNISLPNLDNTPPNINLISPANNNWSRTGNVVFQYNVSDASNIANCELIFNGITNLTDTSITKDTTQDFIKNNLPDGIYNWSINCTDSNSNENTSEFRLLNVTKTGYLSSILINPTTDINVNKDQFFEFKVQVNCLGGVCGDVNASLDPIEIPEEKGEDEKSFLQKVLDYFKSLDNIITAFAVGNLVPTTPTTPFWTNVSNPADQSDFSCLGNMQAGNSCNVTWYVNASGTVGTKNEFFAYFNSTSYPDIHNVTTKINITIGDSNNPVVTDVLATPANINQTQTTNLTANVTDASLDKVKVQITYPDTSSQNFQMTQGSGNGWYYEFTPSLTDPKGTYTALIIANDTSNNLNNTESTTFNVYDVTAPYWSNNNTAPASPVTYGAANYQFNVTWQDNVAVDNVQIEHNFSGSLQNYTVSTVAGNEYYYNYVNLGAGSYVWREYANDTSNNLNQTDQWIYLVNQATPSCSLIFDKTSPQTYGTQTNASCSCTNPETAAVLYRENIDVTSTENNQLITLSAEVHNYTCNSTSTQNYTSATDSASFTINPASTVLTLTSSPSWTETYGTTTTVNCTANNNEVSPQLYQNGSLVSNGHSASLSVGTYNYTCNATASQNYTAAETSNILTVNKAVSSCSLLFDPAVYATYPQQVNASCFCNNPEAAAILYR